MIFAVNGHIEQIIAGTKVQTRRRFTEDMALRRDFGNTTINAVMVNGRVKYRVGGIYSVQPGRGKKGVAKIRITEIRYIASDFISEVDALDEGGYTPDEYYAVLRQLYGDVPAYPMYALTFEYVKGSSLADKLTLASYLLPMP